MTYTNQNNHRKQFTIFVRNKDKAYGKKNYFRNAVGHDIRVIGYGTRCGECHWQPDEPMLTRDLHFVTWKYNYAAREFYEEYLYDEKGNIEFVYNRNADLDEVGGELRLYYKDGKLFKVLVSNLNPETEKYEQTYSGSKMPEKYANALESINYKVGRWKRLFDELDGDTFH